MAWRFLFNHLGFDSAGRKIALLQGEAGAHPAGVSVLDADRSIVLKLPVQALGAVPEWGEAAYWRIDLSALSRPGHYQLWLDGSAPPLVSAPFEVGHRLFAEPLLSDLLNYFKSQRCTGVYDQADRRAPVEGGEERRDAHGGWFDASGDCSKYLTHLSYANHLNPQQTPLLVWNLARTRQALPRQPKWFDERLQDEALHGADFLLRMQHESGFFYQTLFDGWSKDENRRSLCSYATQQGHRSEQYQAGWRQGGGMAIAALAAASSLLRDGAFSRADYLSGARRGFAHLQERGADYLPDGQENLIDDYCALLAACELYAASGERQYADAADERAACVLERQHRDGWFWLDAERRHSFCHASDAGLPYIALIRYLEVRGNSPYAEQAGQSCLRGLLSEVRRTAQPGNPFAYPRQWLARPDDEPQLRFFMAQRNASGYWWQGENARLGSLAAAAWAGAARWPQQAEILSDYAQAAVDWILGRNPFDICMLQGRGRNNPQYEPGYYNANGGVCNGVTAAPGQDAGIAFLRPEQTDISQSWRWSEQWLPHGAWLMLALGLRGGLA
ncbi:glycoside hydrolase family 9 protein [Chromobacterium sp. IIBBL 290-4]|uniref:glycoside hydrolase family 9 protein n=1 Tax=Chromobacterium sp. IIBBL 290-4 TaxID=2953890 RepID=UPI0020B68650|nr:glycoside hydrolase family 9 protein [Chromobacterium sp. IIBBL 290-4]UTH73669.1 glycoside hydrolase family 9 protein [Chromobacterium sp. IIBBL 290-4]